MQQVTSVPQSAPKTAERRAPVSSDGRRNRILAASIYRELRTAGMAEQDVVAVATELLSHVAAELRERRED